jgi:hypothetical protein
MSADAQIAINMSELKNINVEIKRLGNQMKILKNKKKELEENITEYLKEKESEAVRYKSMLVVAKEKKHRIKKNKSERESEIMSILQKAGINNTEKIMGEIKGALQGKETMINCLKIKEADSGIFLGE